MMSSEDDWTVENVPRPMSAPGKLRGYEFYRTVCKNAKYASQPR